MDIDNKINAINQLFDKIDLNLKNCKIKYKNKNDVDLLYKNLTVSEIVFFILKHSQKKILNYILKSLLLNEHFNDAQIYDELIRIEKNLNDDSM